MKTRKIKEAATKNKNIRENKDLNGRYDNDPFFLKKLEMMRQIVKAVGLPKT